MFKRLFTISLMLALFSTFLFAQSERVLLRPGSGQMEKLTKDSDIRVALKNSKIKSVTGDVASHQFPAVNLNAAGTIDTMTYPKLTGGAFATSFVFYGSDVEFMWFVAPADMTIKAAGFSSNSHDDSDSPVSVRMIKLNWTEDQLKNIGAPVYQGYYPSDGDGQNNSDPWGEEATGDWISKDANQPLPPWSDNADPGANTFEYDLWSDFGFGVSVLPLVAPDINTYQWVEMMELGFEPTVLRGEVFAVAVTNDAGDWEGTTQGVTFMSDDKIGYPGWKYYEAGRLSADEPGWWARKYAWNFAVIADLTGDRPPVIHSVTQIISGLDVGPFPVEAKITDDNPSGGNAGIASANLEYTVDGGAMQSVAMTASGDIYSASIPAQDPGSEITYQVTATDVEAGSTTRTAAGFAVFQPVHQTLLLQNAGVVYFAYYFGYVDFDHDVWDYGQGTLALFENYTNIVELCANGGGPSYDNREAIAAWLAGSPTRNYMLIGDEFLGVNSNWTDGPHVAGEFEYDVLGIAYEYNDVNLPDPSYAIPSIVEPVEGSLLAGDLFNSVAAIEGADTMWYDPDYEVGGVNFLDGVDVVEGTEVDMIGYGQDGVTPYNIVTHRTLTAGNKVAFLAYDALALNTSPEYFWVSADSTAPHYQALYWFGAIVVGVKQVNSDIPNSYSISQNYPNPFNPSTTIKFAVPSQNNVTLKVFNTLGQEVALLLNEVKNAGTYEVNFDANNLPSGIYFYTLSSGNFVSTKKMMLIK